MGSNAFSRDSLGTDSTKDFTIQATPRGIPRLRLTDSHSTMTPSASPLNRQ